MSPVPGLIEGPRFIVDNFYEERWERGPDSARRVRELKRLGLTVQTQGYTLRKRWSTEPGADRSDIAAVIVNYSVRPGVVVPLPAAPTPRACGLAVLSTGVSCDVDGCRVADCPSRAA